MSESIFYDGCWDDQKWRLNHLYFINTKSQGIIRFRLNWAQEELLDGMHNRVMILKARQLGMSTFASIFMLDNCLFRNNFTGGIIDQKEQDANEKISKIKLCVDCMRSVPTLGYDHVKNPDDRKILARANKELMAKLKPEINKSDANFANGSKIISGLSLRSTTIHYLHISEYGPIAANNPQRALEIKTGGFPTVPPDGCLIIESTHVGGRHGENYNIIKNSMDCIGKKLTNDEWKFFFFAWWKQKEYRTYSERPLEVGALANYFDNLEHTHHIKLDDAQKRWYYNKWLELDYKMGEEFPSTPDEALIGQVQGSIYGRFILELRKDGRMAAEFEVNDYHPLYISWDLGTADYTSMWLWQVGGDGKFYVVDYFCSHRKAPTYYFNVAKQWERKYGQYVIHLLPHDSKQTDWATNLPRFMAFDKAFGPRSYRLIQRTSRVWEGIDATKQMMRHCVFHKRCSIPVKDEETGEEYLSGVDSLENYRTRPDGNNGAEQNEPLHDESSHGADAFRMFAEALAAGYISKDGVRKMEMTPFSEEKLRKKRKSNGVPKCFR